MHSNRQSREERRAVVAMAVKTQQAAAERRDRARTQDERLRAEREFWFAEGVIVCAGAQARIDLEDVGDMTDANLLPYRDKDVGGLAGRMHEHALAGHQRPSGAAGATWRIGAAN